CGQTTKDTVEVQVWPAGVSGSVRGRTQGYTISPNPTDGFFVLRQSVAEDTLVEVEVHSVLGAVVYKGLARFENGVASLRLTGLAPGMYYMLLADAAQRYVLRFVRRES